MAPINLALNKPASASTYTLPYSASKAVNGSIAQLSRWVCHSLPGWMSVDLGMAYYINRWVVKQMGLAGWLSPDYNISDFKFQGSNDNTNWFDLDTVTGNTLSMTDRTLSIPVYVRYVRVYVTKGIRCNPQLASIVEFEVYAAPASQFLTGITLTSGALTPTPFAGRTTFAYSSSVGYEVPSITLTPVAEDVNAIIKVNGAIVKSNTASSPIALNVGSNTVSVQVTAADGSAQATYTITITRAGSKFLTGLIINTAQLSPLPFDGKQNFVYTSNVANSLSSITVTPTSEYSGSTIKVNGTVVASGSTSGAIALNVGANVVTVLVTDNVTGAQQTYTVTINRAVSNNAFLNSLTLSNITLVQPFNGRTTFAYTSSVANTVTSTVVTAVAEDSAATISVNPASPVALAVGSNTITITVTAADGVTKQTYNVTVTRAAAADPYLKTIAITGNVSGAIPLGQTFDPKNVFNYTALADYDDSSATIAITADDSAATISANGGAFTSSPVTITVAMASPNSYSVPMVVKASDGVTTKSYTLVITRPSSAYLTNIVPSVGTLTKNPGPGTGFTRNYYNYTISTGGAALKVKANLEDSTGPATMTIQIGTGTPTSLGNGALSPPITAPATGSIRVIIAVTSKTGGAVKNYVIDVSK